MGWASRVQICEKSQKIGCVIPHCMLHHVITQPIFQLFSHICTYRTEKKFWYVVARNFFLLLLNFSAWPCLGPAEQDLQTFSQLCTTHTSKVSDCEPYIPRISDSPAAADQVVQISSVCIPPYESLLPNSYSFPTTNPHVQVPKAFLTWRAGSSGPSS